MKKMILLALAATLAACSDSPEELKRKAEAVIASPECQDYINLHNRGLVGKVPDAEIQQLHDRVIYDIEVMVKEQGEKQTLLNCRAIANQLQQNAAQEAAAKPSAH